MDTEPKQLTEEDFQDYLELGLEGKRYTHQRRPDGTYVPDFKYSPMDGSSLPSGVRKFVMAWVRGHEHQLFDMDQQVQDLRDGIQGLTDMDEDWRCYPSGDPDACVETVSYYDRDYGPYQKVVENIDKRFPRALATVDDGLTSSVHMFNMYCRDHGIGLDEKMKAAGTVLNWTSWCFDITFQVKWWLRYPRPFQYGLGFDNGHPALNTGHGTLANAPLHAADKLFDEPPLHGHWKHAEAWDTARVAGAFHWWTDGKLSRDLMSFLANNYWDAWLDDTLNPDAGDDGIVSVASLQDGTKDVVYGSGFDSHRT